MTPQVGPKLPKSAQNSSDQPKTAQDGPRRPKSAQVGPKFALNFLVALKNQLDLLRNQPVGSKNKN